METYEVTSRCPNCEVEGERKPLYFWRRVRLCKKGTTKDIEAVEIYCASCNRTVTVMPASLCEFFED